MSDIVLGIGVMVLKPSRLVLAFKDIWSKEKHNKNEINI